jgi:hypothetical protein
VNLDQKSKATLEGQDGVPVELPAVLLTPGDAELLRKYHAWLDHEHFVAELVCGTCGVVCKTFVTTGDIGIFCECRVSLWKVS